MVTPQLARDALGQLLPSLQLVSLGGRAALVSGAWLGLSS